jgi:hypothetical protein
MALRSQSETERPSRHPPPHSISLRPSSRARSSESPNERSDRLPGTSARRFSLTLSRWERLRHLMALVRDLIQRAARDSGIPISFLLYM